MAAGRRSTRGGPIPACPGARRNGLSKRETATIEAEAGERRHSHNAPHNGAAGAWAGAAPGGARGNGVSAGGEVGGGKGGEGRCHGGPLPSAAGSPQGRGGRGRRRRKGGGGGVGRARLSPSLPSGLRHGNGGGGTCVPPGTGSASSTDPSPGGAGSRFPEGQLALPPFPPRHLRRLQPAQLHSVLGTLQPLWG